jgi:gamma-glutamylcyclotransferase (GGCT)/AIG2-like uncharacterized protein YtfP
MSGAIHHIFVYGTLRSDYHHKAHSYIAKYFTLKGKACVRGKLYDCIEYPAGLPDEENFFIIGELYEIKDASEFSKALQELDDYEGSYDNAGEPALFRRETVKVLYGADEVQAWIYWFNRPITGYQRIISGDILKKDY